MTEDRVLSALGALSNKARLRVLKLLVRAGPAGMPAGEIAAQIGASPSAASFHLSNMAAAGLLTQTRAARSISYCVDFHVMGGLMGYLLNDCCAGDPTVAACCKPACQGTQS